MLKSFHYGGDGSLSLYVPKSIYMPAPEVLSGAWKKPPMEPVQ